MYFPPETGLTRPPIDKIFSREFSRLTQGWPPMRNAQPIRDLIYTRWGTGYYDEPSQSTSQHANDT